MVMMTDDLRSVLVETPGPGIVEDDKVGAGDIGLVLTLLTLYLQYQCQYNAVHTQKTLTLSHIGILAKTLHTDQSPPGRRRPSLCSWSRRRTWPSRGTG